MGQLAVLSTILPHSNRDAADRYRWTLVLGGAVVVILTVAGLLPAAIVAAAFLVPVTYLVYLYDTNVWEDAPAPVVALLFLLTGAVAFGVSFLFFQTVFRSEFVSLLAARTRGGIGSIPILSLILFAVVLPIVAEVVKNVGPVLLARRPAFDDMIDGFTFGVAAGTAYAAFETVVAFGQVFQGSGVQTTDNPATWLLVILNLMVVKSLIYGTATGIAVAAFSGRGEGYSGFKPSYFRAFGLAVVANILYWVGVRLTAYAPFGAGLSLLWGLAIAGFLTLRARSVLQAALVEAAVEDAAADRRPKGAAAGGYCPECASAILPGALFCIVCGASVRATSGAGRRSIRQPEGAPATPVEAGWEGRLFRLGRVGTIAIVGIVVLALTGGALLTAAFTTNEPNLMEILAKRPDLSGGGSSQAGGLALARSGLWSSGIPRALPGGRLGPLAQVAQAAQTVSIGPNGEVPVAVPEGWSVLSQDDLSIFEVTSWDSGGGTAFFAFLRADNVDPSTGATLDPATTAAQLLDDVVPLLLSSDSYFDVTRLGATEVDTFGSITSHAIDVYFATYTDTQGSFPVIGFVDAAIRSDGLFLVENWETDADVTTDEYAPPPGFELIFAPSLESFAGGSPPEDGGTEASTAHLEITGGLQATLDVPASDFQRSEAGTEMLWLDDANQGLYIAVSAENAAGGPLSTSQSVPLEIAFNIEGETFERHYAYSLNGECTVTLQRLDEEGAEGSLECAGLQDQATDAGTLFDVTGTFAISSTPA